MVRSAARAFISSSTTRMRALGMGQSFSKPGAGCARRPQSLQERKNCVHGCRGAANAPSYTFFENRARVPGDDPLLVGGHHPYGAGGAAGGDQVATGRVGGGIDADTEMAKSWNPVPAHALF